MAVGVVVVYGVRDAQRHMVLRRAGTFEELTALRVVSYWSILT